MNFIGYLREYYPDVDIDSILNYSGITIYELKDPGHWFTQRQADRFYEIVLQKTGNRNIAREAGRHFTSSQTSGGLRQYVLGFMTLRYAYHMLEKIVPRLTKASRLETRQIGREKVEVTFWPKPDVNEKPYQCDNRMGMLESMGELFTNKLARVEHPSCLHRRDDVCRYVVAWEKSISFTLNRIRNYFALLSLVGVMVLFFLIPTISLMTFIAFSIYVVLGISLCSSQIEKKELIKNMGSQGSAANELLNEINVRYNNALLIEKVGQAISIILDIDKLLKSIMHAIENLLEFDRGMIMLANRDETQLVYSVGYGYRPEQESAFKKAQFSLASPWSRGVAVRAFKQQKAFLVSDISEIEKDLSQRSLRFLRSTGSQS
ncbi:MAG: GAF domain-containing protein, partial [Thermodesulfobacteriota bacterium]|nr:GAF domain-containing protein [Thermodesulfobacteriota bacterium]